MVSIRDVSLEVAIVPSPVQDRGTGRCRLPLQGIKRLGAKPGDAVVVQFAATGRTFLGSVSLLTCQNDSSVPEDCSKPLRAQVDCCIEFPGQDLSAAALGEGMALVRPLKANLGIAQTVSMRGEGIDGDPPPSVRVAVAAALERHVICRGAHLTVPSVGVISVTATSPDNGAVTVVAKTRVNFLSSLPPSPSPSAASPSLLRSPLASPSPPPPPSLPPSTPPASSTPSSSFPRSLRATTPATPRPPSTPSAKALLLPFSPHSPLARAAPPLAAAVRPPRAQDIFCGEEEIVSALREMLRLIFDRPQSLQDCGLRPAGGVLVHGPRGTGKKVLVDAVAAEVEARVVRIKVDEIYSAGPGEGEALLRQTFRAAAEDGRVVVVLEEVERLCPRRQPGREREARVVGQMLSLLDGGKSDRRGVAVVGISSRPQALDMAMRRPGRLDREVALSSPAVDVRLAMLRRFGHALPLGDPARLPEVAAMCVGFVGADIRALCSLVAGSCIAKAGDPTPPDAPPTNSPTRAETPSSSRPTMTVAFADWERGVRMVMSQGAKGRGVTVETKAGDLDSGVGGLGDVKEVLRRAVEWPLVHAQAFKRMGVRASRGVLLHGPPGCGKTKLVRAVARTAGVGFLQASGAEVMSCYLGESERIVRELFAKGRSMRPCVLFIDEIDALVGKRALDGSGDGGESGGVQQRVLSTLLNEMDGVEASEGVLLVGATNRLDMIDPALLRPGRFDHLLAVPLPDREGREDVLAKVSRGMRLGADVDLQGVAADTHGYSGAELERLCMEAALVALRRDIGAEHVSGADFSEALARVKPASKGGG